MRDCYTNLNYMTPVNRWCDAACLDCACFVWEKGRRESVCLYRSMFSSMCIISYPTSEQSHHRRRHRTPHRGSGCLPLPPHGGNRPRERGCRRPEPRASPGGALRELPADFGPGAAPAPWAALRVRQPSPRGWPCRTPSSKGTEDYGHQAGRPTSL